jgi:hypothetical protein
MLKRQLEEERERLEEMHKEVIARLVKEHQLDQKRLSNSSTGPSRVGSTTDMGADSVTPISTSWSTQEVYFVSQIFFSYLILINIE